MPYNSPSSTLFKKLNIPKLNDIYRIELGKFMYCYCQKTLPEPLMHFLAPTLTYTNITHATVTIQQSATIVKV